MELTAGTGVCKPTDRKTTRKSAGKLWKPEIPGSIIV